jgi:hypothetical protein
MNPSAFAKCAPAVSTNIRECGTVTLCNLKPLTANDLTTVFMKSGQFRVMNALLMHDIELKMCAPVQNGLYNFLMANRIDMSRKVRMGDESEPGLLAIKPFIMAKRYHPINNEWWLAYGGYQDTSNTSGFGTNTWIVNVKSTTNIPADIRSFPPDMYVFAEGVSSGGSATRTAWKVINCVLSNDGTYMTLYLEDMNSGSHLSAAKLGAPVTGLIMRGTNNKADAESWCAEGPAYRNWTKFPFFFQTWRRSFCWSEHYNKWRRYALQNALYEEFFDLPETERNKQLAADDQRQFCQMFFRNPPISNFQTAYDYDKLDPIPSFDPADIGLEGLGVDGGRCVGYRANATGFYDQMSECYRVWDMQGTTPYISDLAILLYNMMRVKQGRDHPKPKVFDLFTDSVSAYWLNTSFLAYYKAQGQGMVQITVEAGKFSDEKEAQFGFRYKTFQLFWPQGVTINVITHEYFDDWMTATTAAVTAGANAAFANTSRVWWIIDWTTTYPGIIASNRVINKSGDLKTLAAIDPKGFGCTMKVFTQEQTLISTTYTVIVDCPGANAIIENIGPTNGYLTGRTAQDGGVSTYAGMCVPDPVSTWLGTFGTVGGAATTTTTTSTTVIYANVEETATWTDHMGVTHTVYIPAGSFHSSASQTVANNMAIDAANQQANELQYLDQEPVETQVGP